MRDSSKCVYYTRYKFTPRDAYGVIFGYPICPQPAMGIQIGFTLICPNREKIQDEEDLRDGPSWLVLTKKLDDFALYFPPVFLLYFSSAMRPAPRLASAPKMFVPFFATYGDLLSAMMSIPGPVHHTLDQTLFRHPIVREMPGVDEISASTVLSII